MATVKTPKTPEKPPTRRRADAIAVNMTLDREVVTLLKQLCPPGRKGTGRLVGRLVYEHVARQEERQRLHERLVTVLEGRDDQK